MAKKHNLEQFMPLLRQYLHLSHEEVEAYLTDQLDKDSLHMVEEHIRRCPQCACEVSVMRDCTVEAKGGFIGALGVAADFIGNVLPCSRAHQPDWELFWLGDMKFPLIPVSDHPGLMEARGLSPGALRRLRRQDLTDPGSVPVAVEGPGRPPVVASLSSFETVGDFRDDEDHQPLGVFAAPMRGIAAFHFMCPSPRPDREGMVGKLLKALPGKGKAEEEEENEEQPKPTLILKGRAKEHDLELFHDGACDKVLLRAHERKQRNA